MHIRYLSGKQIELNIMHNLYIDLLSSSNSFPELNLLNFLIL